MRKRDSDPAAAASWTRFATRQSAAAATSMTYKKLSDHLNARSTGSNERPGVDALSTGFVYRKVKACRGTSHKERL